MPQELVALVGCDADTSLFGLVFCNCLGLVISPECTGRQLLFGCLVGHSYIRITVESWKDPCNQERRPQGLWNSWYYSSGKANILSSNHV